MAYKDPEKKRECSQKWFGRRKMNIGVCYSRVRSLLNVVENLLGRLECKRGTLRFYIQRGWLPGAKSPPLVLYRR